MRARATAHTAPTSRFIDPDVLARISNLELVARTVVEGFISGLHRSPFVGLSLDFAEHRAYMPGDDIRRIDWRLYARTDRFYVKEFEAETNTSVFFALDISRSMDYGSRGLTKLDYGRFLAACLAYLSRQQRDRVGFASFDSDLVEYVPPSATHRQIVLHTIDRIRAGGEGELHRPLSKIGESLRKTGIVVVISDLYAEPTAVLDAVNAVRAKGNDVIVFHLLDPTELEFPFDSPTSFEDLETGDQVPVTPEVMQERYLTLMNDHTASLASLMRDNRIDYALFDTSVPLDGALFQYLALREKRMRTR